MTTIPARRRWRVALMLGFVCAQVMPWPLVGGLPGAGDGAQPRRWPSILSREAATAAAGGGGLGAVDGIDLTWDDGALVVDIDIVGDWGVSVEVAIS